MSGYVGERAKRRKRNFISLLILLIVFLFIYYIMPSLEINENIPSDTFVPTNDELLSPDIETTIEELELKNFDKEQKIIFRNKKIQELQIELENTINKNKNFNEKIIQLNLQLSNVTDKENNLGIEKEFENKLQKLENIISKYENENEQLLLKYTNIKSNYDLLILTNDNLLVELSSNEIINLKLNNLNEMFQKKIKEFELLVNEQNIIIELLKVKNPHN